MLLRSKIEEQNSENANSNKKSLHKQRSIDGMRLTLEKKNLLTSSFELEEKVKCEKSISDLEKSSKKGKCWNEGTSISLMIQLKNQVQLIKSRLKQTLFAKLLKKIKGMWWEKHWDEKEDLPMSKWQKK